MQHYSEFILKEEQISNFGGSLFLFQPHSISKKHLQKSPFLHSVTKRRPDKVVIHSPHYISPNLAAEYSEIVDK